MTTKKHEEHHHITKEEQVGFHKGAIDTLLKERQEMVKIVTIVDQLLKAHIMALQKLGVKITQAAKKDTKSLEKALK